MNLIVSSIVEGVNGQNSIAKKICTDDWTAERTITASNDLGNFAWLLILISVVHLVPVFVF